MGEAIWPLRGLWKAAPGFRNEPFNTLKGVVLRTCAVWNVLTPSLAPSTAAIRPALRLAQSKGSSSSETPYPTARCQPRRRGRARRWTRGMKLATGAAKPRGAGARWAGPSSVGVGGSNYPYGEIRKKVTHWSKPIGWSSGFLSAISMV